MKLFYVRAKTVARVRGISGPIEQTISHLVNAEDAFQAKAKFEAEADKEIKISIVKFAGHPDSITYDYQEVATEI